MIVPGLARLACLVALALPVAAQADSRRDMLTSFDRIRIQGPYVVRLVTGPGAAAVVEGDRGTIDHIGVEVQGTTLIVSPRGYDDHQANAGITGAAVVTLTTPMLRGATVNAGGQLQVTGMKAQRIDLYVGGSGSLTVTGAETDGLNATVMGSGSVTVDGRAQRAHLVVSGPGAIDAANLATNDLDVRLDGAGTIQAAARSTAAVTTLGTGGVTVSGNPSCKVTRTAGGPVVCGK